MRNTSPIIFNDVIDMYIITTIFFIKITIQALSYLLELFTYGIFKKEVLTKSSKIGFDIKIKM